MPTRREPLELPYTEADLDPEQLAIMSLNRLLTLSELSTDQEIMLKSATACATLCVRLLTSKHCQLPLPTEGDDGPDWPLPFIYRQLPPKERKAMLDHAFQDKYERSQFAAWKAQRDAARDAAQAGDTGVPPVQVSSETGVSPVRSRASEAARPEARLGAAGDFEALPLDPSASATTDCSVSDALSEAGPASAPHAEGVIVSIPGRNDAAAEGTDPQVQRDTIGATASSDPLCDRSRRDGTRAPHRDAPNRTHLVRECAPAADAQRTHSRADTQPPPPNSETG